MKQNDVILQTVRRIEDNQASMDRDLAKDRQDLQDLTIKFTTLTEEVAQLRKAVNLNAERIKDKVAEVVEPVIESNASLEKEVKKKEMVFVTEAKSWWQKLTGR